MEKCKMAGNVDNREDDEYANASDCDRIFGKLSSLPSYEQYPELMRRCRPIVELWYDTFASPSSSSSPPSVIAEQRDSQLWRRMRRNVPKELNEIAFILDEMINLCNSYKSTDTENDNANDDEMITIIDMCSGVGYLSMFLSHLLPPEKVSRIIPIDILFPAHNAAPSAPPAASSTAVNVNESSSKTNHVSIDHLRSSIHPIPIHPRRANIKKGRELRQIAKYVIGGARARGKGGPVIILGVHLCKSLSVHTVRLFNTTVVTSSAKISNDEQKTKTTGGMGIGSVLYLKPCCLPGRRDLRRKHPPFWEFGHMKNGGFGVKTLYCEEIRKDGTVDGDGDVDVNVDADGDDATVIVEEFRTGTNRTESESVSAHSHSNQEEEEEVSEQGGSGHINLTGDDTEDKDQQGLARIHTDTDPKSNLLFSKWVNLLRDAVDKDVDVDGRDDDVVVNVKRCRVQLQHFQNQFIVATHYQSH